MVLLAGLFKKLNNPVTYNGLRVRMSIEFWPFRTLVQIGHILAVRAEITSSTLKRLVFIIWRLFNFLTNLLFRCILVMYYRAILNR